MPRTVGRYALYDEIASGGMGVVHFARLFSDGFSRTVAVKRLHEHHARDEAFVAMFLDEARLAARVRHPNVVATLDVVTVNGEIFVVMDYVPGVPLSALVRTAFARGDEIPLPIVSAIVCGALHGLHAAHEAKSVDGEPLAIVHRDVSPENLLVGVDGVPRVLDFGVAKARGRSQTTRDGQLKGKLRYMAPEQLRRAKIDRRTDVYSAGVMLWETLTQQALFIGESEAEVMNRVLERPVEPPSALVSSLPREIDAVVLRALSRDPAARFASARHMALALEACAPIASATRVGAWVEGLAGDVLAARAKIVSEIEKTAPRGAKGRSPWLVAALAAAAASALAFVAAGAPWRAGSGEQRRHAPTTTSAVPPPAAPPPIAAAPVQPVSAPTPAAPPAASPPAPAPPRRAAPVALPAPPAPPAPQPAATKPCAVEWYLDPAGIKHYVKECD